MSISSRISSMEEHVTNAYNGLQGLGADLTGIDKNIDNIASVLDDIYDDLPKVTGSGTSITLDDTRKGRLESTLSGNTSQFTTTGKNLLPNDTGTKTRNGITITKNSDGTYKVNGTATDDISEAICNNFIPMSGTWRMLGCPSGGSENTYMLSAYVGYWGAGSPNIDTGSGTNITYTGNVKVRFYIKSGTTCNNLIFKPMLTTDTSTTINDFEPYTNGASPNPDYPQEVHVVSGDNKINVYGKNLLENQYLPIPSADNTATYEVKNAYLSQGTYTLATTDNSTFGNTVYIKLFKEDKQVVKESGHLSTSNGNYSTATYNYFIGTANNLTYIQFTIDDNYYARIGLLNSDNTKEVMLVKGTEIVRTYEPYSSNSYPINLGVKNLWGGFSSPFSRTDLGVQFIANTDGTITANGTATNVATSILLAEATANGIYKSLPKGTYTVSGGGTNYTIEVYDKDNVVRLAGIAPNSSSASFTISDTTNVVLRVQVASGVTINENIKLQLETGSKANSYTPYGTTPIELCKIGNYQDYFYKDSGKWYLHKEIGKVVLNGSENWGKSSSTANTMFYLSGTIPYKNGTTSSSTDLYCNYFEGKIVWGNNVIGCELYVTNSIRFGLTTSSTITTVEDWKTWLSSHNVVVYYVLATTTIEVEYQSLIDQLNLLEKAMSKDGQTNISQVNNDLPFIISASALKEWSV